MLRKIIFYGGMALVGIGGVMLAVLMGWSIWKLHAFTVLFWELAFSVIMICFVLFTLMRPRRRKWWKTYLVQLAVALVISVGGALATPTLNHWLRG